MSFDVNDPRFSAYLMGELEGDDLREIEALIESDPEAARFVEELSVTADWLGERFEADLVEDLEVVSPAPSRFGAPPRMLAIAAAACLLVVLGIGYRSWTANERNENADRVGRGSHAELPPETPSDANAPEVELSQLEEEVLSEREVANIPVTYGATITGPMLKPSGASGTPRPDEEVEEHDGDDANTESYGTIRENPFHRPTDKRFSTFAIDVDTAAYANLRRLLNAGQRVPKDAVRIEELLNYFPYADPAPTDEHPFAARSELASCPWNLEHRLLRVSLKAKELQLSQRPASNLVFLLDVSGSMSDANKLPLLKRALGLLVENLDERDHVSIVVYAGDSGCALEPTPGDRQDQILAAIDRLQPGGSTNGASGLRLAYDLALRNLKKDGNNRVLLATDGDFNVGITDRGELASTIAKWAKAGIFLSVFGFGMGNYKDDRLETLADRGNGNYAYIDSLAEARKVLVEQMGGTLFTVAKDAKVQIEFNPARVAGYRLIGYENRLLAAKDFADDKKDGGELGAGISVTALYEIVPAGKEIPGAKDPKSRYQAPPSLQPEAASGELCHLRLRYKPPKEDTSLLIERPVMDESLRFDQASDDFRFAAAVASFGMLLRESEHKGSSNWGLVRELAEGALGQDPGGYRRGFLKLVELASKR